jgi:hypothetical protein
MMDGNKEANIKYGTITTTTLITNTPPRESKEQTNNARN